MIQDDGAEVVDDWHPTAANDAQRSLIVGEALPQLDAYLTPANNTELTARVTVLLSHYFVANLAGAAWALIIKDWTKALCSFPMWAVEAGCDRWIAEQPRKPTPAGVRKMVEDAVAEAEEQRRRLRAIIALPPPSNELVAALDGVIPHTAIRTWVAPLTLTVINDVVVVRCPSRFHRDWVRTHYRDAISQAQKGRWVHILAADEPDPKPMTDEDRAAMKNRVARLRGRSPAQSHAHGAEAAE